VTNKQIVNLARFLCRPQKHQHIVQQHLIARLLIAQSRDEAEHVKLISGVFGLFGVHGVSMAAMVSVVC
jgi:hypothetical protein